MKNILNHTKSLMIISELLVLFLFAVSSARAAKVIAVAGGERHSVALKENGTVWAWGANGSGQLGNGEVGEAQYNPVQVVKLIGNLTNISAIAAGTSYWLDQGGHTLALQDNGTVWAWGYGLNGQLGDGAGISRSLPVEVSDSTDPTDYLTGAIAIGAGDLHSIAVKNDGTVWTWGNNDYGQIGDGTQVEKFTPVQVSGLSDVTAVAAGASHSLALKSDGTVWAWGANNGGQLGDGTWGWPESKTIPVQVLGPSDTPGFLTNIIAIAAGDEHSIALKADSTVWTWGGNPTGQLGIDTAGWYESKTTPVQVLDASDPTGYLTNIIAIAGGDDHSMALKADGTVRTFGANNWGQLGDGTNEGKNTPVQVSGLTDVIALGAGNGHSLAIKNDGSVWTWGANWAGQLGDGTIEQKLTPVQVIFTEPEEDNNVLDIRGPYYVTSGEQVDFLVSYNNITTDILDDAVIIMNLPENFSYISSTKNGEYRDDMHQIFWTVGDIDPGDTGYMTTKVEIPWGLPPHTEGELFARIIALNINEDDEFFNVDDYVNQPQTDDVLGTELSQSEINSILMSDDELKENFEYALGLGYLFHGVAWEIDFSEGQPKQLFAMIDPQEASPVFLYRGDESVILIKQRENHIDVFDTNGGFSRNLDDATVNAWGSWSQQESQPIQQDVIGSEDNEILSSKSTANSSGMKLRRSDCVMNCILETKRYTRYGKYNALGIKKIMKGRTCTGCLQYADDQYCKVCQKMLFKDFPFAIAGRMSQCVSDCGSSPEKYKCTKDLTSCGGPSLYAKLYWGVWRYSMIFELPKYTASIYKFVCKEDGTYETPKEEDCPSQYWCRQWGPSVAECYHPERQCGYAFTGSLGSIHSASLRINPISLQTTTSARICKKRRFHSQEAHDPNAKHVDFAGNVISGQTLNYTIEYENEGEGIAYDVFIMDQLDTALDETTLVINDGGMYSDSSRLISWDIGEVPPEGQGLVSFSIKVKEGLPEGTEIINFADVHFPSALEVTPTNPVVNVIRTIAADPQTLETTAGIPVDIMLTGREIGGGALSYEITAEPFYGRLDGTPPILTYTPAEDFSGQDEFYFTVSTKQKKSEPARVFIKIAPNLSDNKPPQIIETNPSPDASNIHVDNIPQSTEPDLYIPVISTTFSEPVDLETITSDTFTVDGLTGAVYYDEQLQTAYFIPSSALKNSTTYTARLSTGIKDKVGNALASEYSWQFTTESPANIKATLPDNAEALYLGAHLINTTSDEQIISIASTGTTDLELGGLTLTGADAGDFMITEDTCSGQTLAQFQNCTARIAFAPASVGSKTANLSVPSNDPDTPVLEIPFTARCVESYAQYGLTAVCRPFFGGTLTGDGISCPGDCSETYNEETKVVIAAVAKEGFTFSGWEGGDCGGSPYCFVNMTDDVKLTARFEPDCPAKIAASGDRGCLNSLYAFRDQILARDERGAVYRSAYDTYADEVSVVLLSQPLLLQRVKELLHSIKPQMAKLTDGDHAVISEEILHEGISLIDALIAVSDTELSQILRNLKSDLQDRRWLKQLGINVR